MQAASVVQWTSWRKQSIVLLTCLPRPMHLLTSKALRLSWWKLGEGASGGAGFSHGPASQCRIACICKYLTPDHWPWVSRTVGTPLPLFGQLDTSEWHNKRRKRLKLRPTTRALPRSCFHWLPTRVLGLRLCLAGDCGHGRPWNIEPLPLLLWLRGLAGRRPVRIVTRGRTVCRPKPTHLENALWCNPIESRVFASPGRLDSSLKKLVISRRCGRDMSSAEGTEHFALLPQGNHRSGSFPVHLQLNIPSQGFLSCRFHPGTGTTVPAWSRSSYLLSAHDTGCWIAWMSRNG